MLTLTGRRRFLLPICAAFTFLLLYACWTLGPKSSRFPPRNYHQVPQIPGVVDDPKYMWRQVPTHYPVAPESMRRPPPPPPQRSLRKLPPIQARSFGPETTEMRRIRLERREAVRRTFERCWSSYARLALPEDELAPISGGPKKEGGVSFGGWGATLVDSLDTLWVMGYEDEFFAAAAAAARIDFTNTPVEGDINVFETTIRYLGGFLAAYDLSGDPRMLRKAREVGDMLYKAFDTPNRMPISRWDLRAARQGQRQGEAPSWALLAEVGSFCLEFTRLSVLTGNPKWFDAAERIREVLEAQQENTKIPGMWPIGVNPRDERFDEDATFGLGAMADSTYEYLPKMSALLGGYGPAPAYEAMYARAAQTSLRHTIFRPMTPDGADILFAGSARAQEVETGSVTHPSFVPGPVQPHGQHLACFAGGMFALGSRLLSGSDASIVHLDAARRLTDGCIWAYANTAPLGIMPETFEMVACNSAAMEEPPCSWDEGAWKRGILQAANYHVMAATSAAEVERVADAAVRDQRLSPGFTAMPDRRYVLRPEAIESVFVLWRVTGDRRLLDRAWEMFAAVDAATRTELASAALKDVTVAPDSSRSDSMESFWLAETLKYFYLVFSDPDLLSLDDWVFNTEAHPFRRLDA